MRDRPRKLSWRPNGQRLVQLLHLRWFQVQGILPRPEDGDPEMRKLIAQGFIDPEQGYRFNSRDLVRTLFMHEKHGEMERRREQDDVVREISLRAMGTPGLDEW